MFRLIKRGNQGSLNMQNDLYCPASQGFQDGARVLLLRLKCWFCEGAVS